MEEELLKHLPPAKRLGSRIVCRSAALAAEQPPAMACHACTHAAPAESAVRHADEMCSVPEHRTCKRAHLCMHMHTDG